MSGRTPVSPLLSVPTWLGNLRTTPSPTRISSSESPVVGPLSFFGVRSPLRSTSLKVSFSYRPSTVPGTDDSQLSSQRPPRLPGIPSEAVGPTDKKGRFGVEVKTPVPEGPTPEGTGRGPVTAPSLRVGTRGPCPPSGPVRY